jgi:hypothetical protein
LRSREPDATQGRGGVPRLRAPLKPPVDCGGGFPSVCYGIGAIPRCPLRLRQA